MTYVWALLACSVFVAALEAFAPRRGQQPQLRRRLVSDLLMLAFNGHFLGAAVAIVAGWWLVPRLDGLLASAHAPRDVVTRWPLWAQIILVLLVMDFAQWCIHRLLHRVPFLWRVHQVHHSVVDGEMDWIVSFRVHWGEVLVYKALQYLPLTLFGFHPTASMVHAVVGTLVGHLNHANLDWGYGPWRYVLNNPRMHLWHHDQDAPAGQAKNFGVIFSCWDHLFGTAHPSDGAPRALAFPDVEHFPSHFFSQLAWPLQRLAPGRIGAVVASATGVALVGGAIAVALLK